MSATVGYQPTPEMAASSSQYIGKSAEEMDEERQQQMAYQYLCHLEEAKTWMEKYLGEELPPTTELEDSLRNGVILAKLACLFAPTVVKPSKIFDLDERKYNEMGLHFRHTDNINYFLKATSVVGLGKHFTPETTDVYDKKNMPRLIFCIHALSHYLYMKGLVRHCIQDLYGKAVFTQEEISAMRQALEAVGLSMLPQFRRIGGMMADEVPIDAAAMHAAILAINDALEHDSPKATLAALQNPDACLSDVDASLAAKYDLVLRDGKRQKLAKNCENFATDGDAYDEMLTREEIQSIINKMNLLSALERVEDCVKNHDIQNLQYALMSRHINLKSQVKIAKMEEYCRRLAKILNKSADSFLRPDDIERAVSRANQQGDEEQQEEEVVSRINELVKSGRGATRLAELLSHPALGIGEHILPIAVPLYLSELGYLREQLNKDLQKSTIVKTCKFLHNVAHINAAVREGDIDRFWTLLSDGKSKLEDLDPKFVTLYFEAITSVIKRRETTTTCWLLNHADIQECIDQVNAANSSDLRCIEAIQRVNAAVAAHDPKALYAAIHSPDLNLAECLEGEDCYANGRLQLSEDDATHFLDLLIEIQQNRSQAENEESSLWMENIVEAVRFCYRHGREAVSASTALAILNMAVLQKDPAHTLNKMRHRDLLIPPSSLRDSLSADYQRDLYVLLKSKEGIRNAKMTPWVWHRLRSGDMVYLNLQKHSYAWNAPRNFDTMTSQYLSTQELREVVEHVNESVDNDDKFFVRWEPLMTKFQACCRGFLVRQKLFTMLEHYYQNQDKIVKVQALWRGKRARRAYAKLRAQNQWKLKKQRSAPRLRKIEWYRPHEKKIIKIQRFWRAHHYKKEFQQLVLSSSSDIKLTTLRQFLHLLDLRSEDFDQELELQSLKGQISQLIRHNQALEKDLDAMDIKIGLLIKNRIDLDEVMAHHNKLLKIQKQSHKELAHPQFSNGWMDGAQGAGSSGTLPRGLKALKKESRQKLDAYQHLFYRLQTCPEYLAKLIFAIPQSSSNKFLDSVILTLYNFGANPREEYMLLKLFQTALEEEIANKVHQLNDIVSGNPLVIKMVVSYYRGKGSLAELLGPLVRSVIDDKNLHINLIPVEIYKQWINSLEFDSGKACGMPYDVSTEEALKYPEVKARFEKSIVQLKQFTTLFLATIIKAKSKNLLPFGLLHLSKVLYESLRKKFPGVAHKDVLKVVGNLIYYRYINSGIVAPDVFGIIDKASIDNDGGLNPDQRRNLGNIAKILQFAAAKKGFGEESSYLTTLNTYIIECHEKFKKFFAECCCDKLPDPSEAFATDQYTEAALIAKPVIYISLQEICDTHKLLLENVDVIAPDKKDKLRELLDDLGDSPSLLSLMGAADSGEAGYDGTLNHLGKTEVCLTLTNKFTLDSAEDRASTDRLFVKTKQLLASVLPCTKESNLIGCLKSATTPEQSNLYWELVEQKLAAEGKAEQNRTMLEHTNLFADDDERLPLDECKVQILKNLQILERHGYVTSKDGCQAILASLARDICNQKEYRSRRRREIFKLRRTIRSLQTKSKFHEEQISSYNAYLKQCLANLQKIGDSKKRVRFRSLSRTPRAGHVTTLRYSASKLHQKGILLSIDGLPQGQFKNVLFEFVTSGDGVFEIHAKFMGVRLEHVEVDIQELLQMQYEGVTVMNIFGKAKINVNLLLHFLNTKFYGRKR